MDKRDETRHRTGELKSVPEIAESMEGWKDRMMEAEGDMETWREREKTEEKESMTTHENDKLSKL